MKIISDLTDSRINAKNYLIEIEIKEYLALAKKILTLNEYQRKRVKSSYTIYSLLKEDLKKGCLIPPIVLASGKENVSGAGITKEKLEEELKEGNFLILDGLQRTYTLLDLEKDLIASKDNELLESINKRKLRIEIYYGINRLGILYRMLTLNTGQTPVSLRHQIEILYLDYLHVDFGEIKLLRETDDETPTEPGEYRFKDVVEGFNSYLERNEFPLDRFDLLENIKGLEKLSKENQQKDLFKEYIETFHKFIVKVSDLASNWEYTDDKEIKITGMPFGTNTHKIFGKSQVMTGFGSAVGKVIDFQLLENIEQVNRIIDSVTLEKVDDTFKSLLEKLDEIKNTSKKIGNAQRMFFHYFFRELFNKESDSYLKIDLAVETGFRKYLSQTA